MKKTHNRVGRFAAAFESIQRRLQLESHPTAGSASGSHSSTLPSPLRLPPLSEKNTSYGERERERGSAVERDFDWIWILIG